MTNRLVKQIVNDDGEEVPFNEQCWHALTTSCSDAALLCTGEYVVDSCASGNGQSYEFKDVKRGGITCQKCLSLINEIKSIRL